MAVLNFRVGRDFKCHRAQTPTQCSSLYSCGLEASGGLRSEWRKRSTRFGFYISFSKFQNLGVAGVVERDYIGETDTLLEDIRLREKELKKLALCCLTLTMKECQFVL